ncbi:MAG: hypothetical protein GY941_11230 [Planctomycetes bacterium]|nr:hypothetical protein [Planctomycetota bacterium]
MRLSEKQIADFQKLYKNRFGIEISQKEALEKGLSVLSMVKEIVKPHLIKRKPKTL